MKFKWKLLQLLSLIFLIFTISLVGFTLHFTNLVQNSDTDVNEHVLNFVKIGNWIQVGIYICIVITSIMAYPFAKDLVQIWNPTL